MFKKSVRSIVFIIVLSVLINMLSVGRIAYANEEVSTYPIEELKSSVSNALNSSADMFVVPNAEIVKDEVLKELTQPVVDGNNDKSNNTDNLEVLYTDAEITSVYSEVYSEDGGIVFVDIKNLGHSNSKMFWCSMGCCYKLQKISLMVI